MEDIKTNKVGLYFEDNKSIFDLRTYYPKDYNPNTDTKFISNISHDWSKYNHDMPERLFWAGDLMIPSEIFRTFTFYYAEINHPKMGTAIYGSTTNRGFMWKFDSEKDLKCSMCRSIGYIYKKMIKDGYIKIKVGKESYTRI